MYVGISTILDENSKKSSKLLQMTKRKAKEKAD